MKLTTDSAQYIIEKSIINKTAHPYYDRVKSLTTLYKQLITGDKAEDLLSQFIKREDSELFEQRKRLTQIITPSVAASIRNPFYKVGRVNNITKKITFENTDEDVERKERLTNALSKYYGTKSIDSYLQTQFVDLSFTDPNAFIVTEFDPVEIGPQGQLLKFPQPRPFEVSSEEAINFEYDNNVLQWLLIQLPVTYKNQKGEKKNGHSYTIYFPEQSIRYTQTDSERYLSVQDKSYMEFVVEDKKFTVWRADKDKVFIIETFDHKSKIVPAIRVGYKMDLVTNGATCINPMHDALPYFLKSIKTVSEFDLTMCLHAFPQKFQYVNRCTGINQEVGCSGGMTTAGNVCTKCNGSGLSIHSSAQDAVVMKMPKDKDEMLDLQQMVHYEHPPIELLEFQNKYILQLEEKAKQAVFNSDIFAKGQVTQTATEAGISYDAVKDTLSPFAEKISDVYVTVANVSAYYLDITDASVTHKFPKDFKLKPLTELLTELKTATESNAPGYVRKELSNDIAEQQFLDKPEELKRIRIKEKLYPFPDKTPTEIQYILSNGKTTRFNEVLWANFDTIFNDLEEEQETNKMYLYDLALPKIKALLKAKVDAIIAELDGEQPAVSVKMNPDNIQE
jgi:hypothetical protein